MNGTTPITNRLRRGLLASLLLGAGSSISGCLPIVATGTAVGTLAAIDRRTLGAQTEDQGIELKGAARIHEQLGRGVSVTSYNRKVLLTGQVARAEDKREAEAIIAALPNVRSIHNELQVAGVTSLTTTAADASITTRVKTAFVNVSELQANTIKVVTEAGVVYLMGLVSAREGELAARAAASVAGVQRVVTVFEYLSEEEVKKMKMQPRP